MTPPVQAPLSASCLSYFSLAVRHLDRNTLKHIVITKRTIPQVPPLVALAVGRAANGVFLTPIGFFTQMWLEQVVPYAVTCTAHHVSGGVIPNAIFPLGLAKWLLLKKKLKEIESMSKSFCCYGGVVFAVPVRALRAPVQLPRGTCRY